jgi:hypothetical protein
MAFFDFKSGDHGRQKKKMGTFLSTMADGASEDGG